MLGLAAIKAIFVTQSLQVEGNLNLTTRLDLLLKQMFLFSEPTALILNMALVRIRHIIKHE